MSNGELANHWPAADVDTREQHYARLVSLSDLAGIVTRMRRGDGTLDDRLALIDLASEIDRDAAGTELAELATALRRVALRVDAGISDQERDAVDEEIWYRLDEAKGAPMDRQA